MSDASLKLRPDSQANSVVDSLRTNNEKNDSTNEVEKRGPVFSSRSNIYDILALVGLLVMFIWPWVFLGVIWAKNDLQASDTFANVVTNNSHSVTYVVTFISSIIASIVTALFSYAIVRFAQEWIKSRKPTRAFHLKVLLALRHQNMPWKLEDFSYLISKHRWWPAFLVLICFLSFPHLISSPTSLITPGTFKVTETLTGTELDFSSTSANCLSWFDANRLDPLSADCTNWRNYNGLNYTECVGENLIVDILESVRASIESNRTIELTQLGASNGLQFNGTTQGVFLVSPDNSTALNTFIGSSRFLGSNSDAIFSHNYTVDAQGIIASVNCSYEQTSPLATSQDALTDSTTYIANCSALGQTDVLTNGNYFPSLNSNSTLAYWACQSAPNGTQTPSYFVYLYGLGKYETIIGNITCNLSPIQLGIFQTTYQSGLDIFSVDPYSISLSPLAFSALSDDMLIAMGGIISASHNAQSNLIADFVDTLGTKFFGDKRDVLGLYERMILAFLEYEASYMRLLYSIFPDRPSCNRTVTANMTFEVVGWSVTLVNVGFLMPMTIITLAALFALIRAMSMARSSGPNVQSSDGDIPVAYDEGIDMDEDVPDEWRHKISFRPTTALKKVLDSSLQN